VRRRAYRQAFEDLLVAGDRQGVLSVENSKIAGVLDYRDGPKPYQRGFVQTTRYRKTK